MFPEIEVRIDGAYTTLDSATCEAFKNFGYIFVRGPRDHYQSDEERYNQVMYKLDDNMRPSDNGDQYWVFDPGNDLYNLVLNIFFPHIFYENHKQSKPGGRDAVRLFNNRSPGGNRICRVPFRFDVTGKPKTKTVTRVIRYLKEHDVQLKDENFVSFAQLNIVAGCASK